MGMARLNVWVSGMDDPCTVDDKHQWFVTIYRCDGKVLEWCGRNYVVLPAKCGHLEIDVPPGVYYLKAVWSFSLDSRTGTYYVNHFTDAAIVEACCEKTVCVKLFNPSVHRCGTIFVRAVLELAEQKLVKPEAAKKLEGMVNETLAQIPAPAKGFELDHIDKIRAQAKESLSKMKTENKKRAE